MSDRVQLRPHQREAVAAGVDALSGTRHAAATIIAACGTGKTLIGKRVAEHFAERGPVLVLVPTLELLTQTAAHWLADGGFDQLIGVCSLPGVHDRSLRGHLLLTGNPQVLARRVAEGGRIVVFATYASLPTIAEAHRDQRLPAWAFALADEAHRTSGDWDKRWALIHDDRAIPAAHRLYVTATPRNWRTTPNPKARTRIERLASMDDPTIYGPVVYRLDLAEAIARGVLADYQLIVPEVQDSMLRDILHDPLPTPHQDGLRLAAMQAALLMSMAEHDVRRVLSFHGRIAAARGFVASLPETADVLAERTGIRNPWAHALYCGQAPWRRQQIFREFEHFSAHTQGSTAASHDCAVLASVRVLSEGVDAPDTDGILIADPRRSPSNIAQSIGRALRKPPGQAKCASIFIPVYIAPGQSTRQAMESSSFSDFWRFFNGLALYDSRAYQRFGSRHKGAAAASCAPPAPRRRGHPHPEAAHPQSPQQGLLERRPAGRPGLPHPPPSPERPQ
jgi:predicted helicase